MYEELRQMLIDEIDKAIDERGREAIESLMADATVEQLADEARERMPEALPGMRLGPLAVELRRSALYALLAARDGDRRGGR